ncbi:MAG: hypothetical protein Q4B94_00465 [Pseudomonadota bacterium]|nr:hypothetical protein [Pseudomonadota bacterium]
MPKSPHLSSASATCRLEWQPSRFVETWLLSLSLLAPLALWASALPRMLALALMPLVAALAWLALWRYRKRPRYRLLLRADGGLWVDEVLVEDWQLQWRGALAFLQWREGGRSVALDFWPDTLPARLRRELRLASPPMSAVSAAAGMAT